MDIAIDIGGTKTRIAASEDMVTFAEPIRLDTPQSFDEGMAAIAAAVQSLLKGEQARRAIAGVPGTLAKDGAGLYSAPNLTGWAAKPLKAELEKIMGCPTVLKNDSALVGLGEAVVGAGKGYGIVAYVTVSTGVGGARIVDGKIDRTVFGFEPGHQVIDMDGTVAPFLGVEAEDLVSGSATEVRFGKKAYQVAEEGAWEELARWVSYLLNNTIVHWSPDAVVLGGSMIVGNPAIGIDRIRYYLSEVLTVYPELPAIVPAALSDVGGIHGGLCYLRDIPR